MRAIRRNQRYLPDISLPAGLELSADFSAALQVADLAIIAVPVSALRPTLHQLGQLPVHPGVVWVCKGFEAETSLLPRQVFEQVLPDGYRSGVLSGPSFGQEVARGLPTALTLASSDEEFARSTAQALRHAHLRIYASGDVAVWKSAAQ